MKKHLPAIVLILSLLLSTSASALHISGASTIQPLFETLNETRGGLSVRGGGSGAGIREVLAGEADLGMVSRPLSPEEQAQLQYRTIGMDALVVIVNRRNPLSGLSRQEIRDIYTGNITSWQQFGFGQNIILITKEMGRATLDLFEGYTGLESPQREGTGTKISPAAHTIGSNLEALTLVGGLPGAIGYVSYGTASQLVAAGMPVKILALDGVAPNLESIAGGTYPILRELNLVYTSQEARAFVESLNTAEMQAIIESYGFTPVWQ